MSNNKLREKKYQVLRAFHSGRLSLTDLKMISKLGSVGALDEFMAKKDKKDLLSLEGGIHRLTMTRGDAKRIAEVKFKPRRLPQNREDFLGSYYSGHNQKIDWRREEFMKRKKGSKPAKPRPGSSKGKIGRTTVTGADKTLKDFEMLVKSLQRLQNSGDIKPGDTKALQKQMKAIRTSIKPKG